MKKKKKKRIFKALDAQIRRISKDVAQNFVLLAESLDLMESYELYEFEPNINNFRSYRKSVGLDHSRPGKIINIINFFNPYHDRPKGAYLMYQAGWTKLDLITGKKDKFEKALELGYLNFDDLALYAYKSTYRNLESKLENLNPPKLWDNVYSETHKSIPLKKPHSQLLPRNTIGDVFFLGKILDVYSFDHMPSVQIKNIRSYPNSKCREVIGYLRHAFFNIKKIDELFGVGPSQNHQEFINHARPNGLAKIEKASIRVDPGFKGRDEIAIKKLLNRILLTYEDLLELGIPNSRIKKWIMLEETWIPDRVPRTEEYFSLKSVRKLKLSVKKIDRLLREQHARKEINRIVNEEVQFRILTPYYELAGSILDLLDDREE